MLKLVYVGGLGMMAGPASLHLTPATTARVLRVHDRGSSGGSRDRFRSAWKKHGAELVSDFDRLVGDGNIDGVVICAGKNGDDLSLVAQLTPLLEKQSGSRAFILHLSTVSPAFVNSAAQFCGDAGVDYVNYPLTGGPLGASLGGSSPQGMLILASGQRPIYQRLLPMLEQLGNPRYFGDDPGAGAITKLIGHHLVFNGLAGISAATAIHSAHFNRGQLGGEEQSEFLRFLNGGAGGTRQWDVGMSKGIAENVWDAGFLIPHAVVDAIYAARLALDCALPRFSVQSVINIAYAFSFVLDRYPGMVLATHAIVREMVSTHSASIDEFMKKNGAFHNEGDSLLDACINSLPDAVKRSVLLSPRPQDFADAVASNTN